MPFITWNEGLSVGIDEFDAEHKKLIALLNQLHEAMSLGRGKDVLGQVLSGLRTYVATHFEHEERMMARFGYPGLAAHKSEHDKLTAEIRNFEDRFAKGEAVLSLTLMTFLKDWLQRHIKGTDAQYRSHLAGKVGALAGAR